MNDSPEFLEIDYKKKTRREEMQDTWICIALGVMLCGAFLILAVI